MPHDVHPSFIVIYCHWDISSFEMIENAASSHEFCSSCLRFMRKITVFLVHSMQSRAKIFVTFTFFIKAMHRMLKGRRLFI